MPTYICTLSWTDQGIKFVKDAPKRRQRARQLAQKLGIVIKDIYITSGERDIMIIMEAPDEDAVAALALAAGSQGNTRSSTCRAFTEAEFERILNEMPEV